MRATCALFLLSATALAQFVGPTVPASAGVTVVNSLTTCSSPARGNLEFLTTDSLVYLCDGSDWRHMYTTADGTLPAADAVVPGLTFEAAAASGQHAVELNTGARVCLNGDPCTVYAQYDGGTVGIVGAELEVPSGIYNSQPVNPDAIITPEKVIAQAASGQKAFGVAHDGARIYFGESGNVYCANVAGEVTCASAWKMPTISVDTIGSYTSNRHTDLFRVHMFPTSVGNLGTCNGVESAGNNSEGLKVVITGASLGAQTRECMCVSDGTGTPSYYWINTGCPNTAGTSTTCPACP